MPKRVTDDDVEAGREKLRKLLADPSEFEKWANDTLDKAYRRKR